MNRLSFASSCVAACCLALATPVLGQELLPNLRAYPASNLTVSTNAETGNPELRFSATSWNSGAGPLELLPGVGDVVTKSQDVFQRVYQSGGGYQDYPAGTFIYHPDHQHFHFQEYALYTLAPLNAPGASRRESYKTSFCVMDTTKVDTRLPGAAKKPVYFACDRSVQGMSVGWGDTYGAHLPGQEIDLTGNPDGIYELSTSFDPFDRIHETNDNDNAACVRLQISVTNKTVQVLGACGFAGGGVSLTSIEPASVWVGTVVDVIIKGSNFSPGLAVGFENGSGSAPVASNITVLDGSTITATVTVKSGGPRGDPVWDVRVGSAVLADGFEVRR